jgi:general secretion pathway protein N
MPRPLTFFLLALMTVLIVVGTLFPAAWLSPLIQRQTAGKVALGDPDGSIWKGCATPGDPTLVEGKIVPFLAGRFCWQLSPLLLIGRLKLTLDNALVLAAPVELEGTWPLLRISAGSLRAPASSLTPLGAPFNTVNTTGQLRLSWDAIELATNTRVPDIRGNIRLDMTNSSSSLSAVKPLGSYQLQLLMQGQRTKITLQSSAGPLRLNGTGSIAGKRVSFSGQGEADTSAERQLIPLLAMLGRPLPLANKKIFQIEIK